VQPVTLATTDVRHQLHRLGRRLGTGRISKTIVDAYEAAH
jgi:hypothetical protein